MSDCLIPVMPKKGKRHHMVLYEEVQVLAGVNMVYKCSKCDFKITVTPYDDLAFMLRLYKFCQKQTKKQIDNFFKRCL